MLPLNQDVVNNPPRNTRAATRKKFVTVKYENMKYRNRPYYKAAKLWDTLPKFITDTLTLTELKRLHLTLHRLTIYIPKLN